MYYTGRYDVYYRIDYKESHHSSLMKIKSTYIWNLMEKFICVDYFLSFVPQISFFFPFPHSPSYFTREKLRLSIEFWRIENCHSFRSPRTIFISFFSRFEFGKFGDSSFSCSYAPRGPTFFSSAQCCIRHTVSQTQKWPAEKKTATRESKRPRNGPKKEEKKNKCWRRIELRLWRERCASFAPPMCLPSPGVSSSFRHDEDGPKSQTKWETPARLSVNLTSRGCPRETSFFSSARLDPLSFCFLKLVDRVRECKRPRAHAYLRSRWARNNEIEHFVLTTVESVFCL